MKSTYIPTSKFDCAFLIVELNGEKYRVNYNFEGTLCVNHYVGAGKGSYGGDTVFGGPDADEIIAAVESGALNAPAAKPSSY